MKHLSLEEITEFAALDKKDKNGIKLAVKVYSHAAVCEDCRRALTAVLSFSESSKELAFDTRRETGRDRVKIIAKKMASESGRE